MRGQTTPVDFVIQKGDRLNTHCYFDTSKWKIPVCRTATTMKGVTIWAIAITIQAMIIWAIATI